MSSVADPSLSGAFGGRVAATRRPRLITPPALLVVAGTVAASLALLFPGQDFGHPRFLAHPDEVSIAYLSQVLQQRPGDRPARLLLARQEVALGKWAAAETNLRRLAGDASAPARDAISWRARVALVELERAQVDALPAGDPARASRQAAALADAQGLVAAPLDGAELARVAGTALALGSPLDAAAIYERLAREQPARRREWALLAGRWYRAANHLSESATAYLEASAAAGARQDGAGDALAAVQVLRAADDGPRALAVIDQALARWPGDRRLLQQGVTLALAQQDLARAQGWGARLVALDGRDESTLRRQFDIDLAAGDTPAALAVGMALLDARPDDVTLRQRVAQVATWAGQPRVALAAYVWLAAHGAPGAREQALELGRALFDHRTVIALLETAARRRELKLDELLELADAFESQGNPDDARAILRRFQPLFQDDARYWTERAAVDEHVGDLEGALFSVREISRKFAGSVEPAREAELLWSLDRPQEALAVARLQAQTAPPSASSFWRLFGDLAWSMDEDADAEKAYRQVWSAGAGDAEIAERLATLLAERGQIDDLARVGAEAYQKLRASSVLLTAMDAATEAEQWEPARLLASIAAPHRSDFEDEPDYWSVLGRLASHDGKPSEAASAFAKAVALAPRDTGLAEDLHDARVQAGLESDPDDAEDTRARAADEASNRLSAAIDRHDRSAVRQILASDGGLLTVSERIDAERELGHDDRAWALLMRAPLHTGDADEDASLALHRLEMSEDRLSGVYAKAGYEDLSTLGMLGQSARAELRRGQLSIEALAGHDRLDSPTGPVVGAIHADEAQAGLGLSLQEAQGDTRVEAGAYAFSTGTVPYATAVQSFEPLHGLTFDFEGQYHERPTDTAALRAAALKDTAEAEIAWQIGDRFRIAAGGGATHYADRDGAFLAAGGVGRMELSAVLRRASPLIRLRADGFVEANRLATVIPAGLAAVVPPGTPTGDVVPETYGTAGIGLTILGLSEDEDDMASGRGPLSCRRCLRPLADLWAGWLMPAQTITYSFDAGMGYLFARHQELAATGFYRNDQGGQVGQRYLGLSLHYALRWN
jgi:tetratricopeptide (TPR) repeat protein